MRYFLVVDFVAVFSNCRDDIELSSVDFGVLWC